jgi:hypothetical protein
VLQVPNGLKIIGEIQARTEETSQGECPSFGGRDACTIGGVAKSLEKNFGEILARTGGTSKRWAGGFGRHEPDQGGRSADDRLGVGKEAWHERVEGGRGGGRGTETGRMTFSVNLQIHDKVLYELKHKVQIDHRVMP